MSRGALKEFLGQRRRFKGVFVRVGKKRGWKAPLTTLLLSDIVDVKTGKSVADHLWFTMGKRFGTLSLQPGDIVKFDARVTEYVKGYNGFREDVDKPLEKDFRLSFPTNVETLSLDDRACLVARRRALALYFIVSRVWGKQESKLK